VVSTPSTLSDHTNDKFVRDKMGVVVGKVPKPNTNTNHPLSPLTPGTTGKTGKKGRGVRGENADARPNDVAGRGVNLHFCNYYCTNTRVDE